MKNKRKYRKKNIEQEKNLEPKNKTKYRQENMKEEEEKHK
jgi:hypothetical protein